jgi:hypothetical protein
MGQGFRETGGASLYAARSGTTNYRIMMLLFWMRLDYCGGSLDRIDEP